MQRWWLLFLLAALTFPVIGCEFDGDVDADDDEIEMDADLDFDD